MAQSKESAALAEELEKETAKQKGTSLLEGHSDYINFPVDEYTPACILSYQVANIPVSPKFLKKGQKESRPSVRFMFAAHNRDEAGNPLFVEDEENGVKVLKPQIIRKWTKWLAISYSDNAGLRKLFVNVDNVQTLLKSDGLVPGGNGVNNALGRKDKLWNTQFQIFVEAKGEKYTDITKVKIDDKLKTNELDIDYSEDYIPYRTANAFGNKVPLESAVCKLADHIHLYTQDTMVDEPKKDK